MSRIGKKPIVIPSGVDVQVSDKLITVKGGKGTLETIIFKGLTVAVADGQIVITRSDDERQSRAWHGLLRALTANMVHGVSTGFEKKLDIVGVGYRAEVRGNVLVLNVGYSMPKEVKIPEGLHVSVEKSTIKIEGVDKQLVGEFAAEVRAIRPPEPYKGKGIKYSDEKIRRKAGKAGKAEK